MVSIAISLGLTWIVFLLLPEYADRLSAEQAPLGRAAVLATVLAAIAGASFYGELRRTPWRRGAQSALLAGLAFATWMYWPS